MKGYCSDWVLYFRKVRGLTSERFLAATGSSIALCWLVGPQKLPHPLAVPVFALGGWNLAWKFKCLWGCVCVCVWTHGCMHVRGHSYCKFASVVKEGSQSIRVWDILTFCPFMSGTKNTGSTFPIIQPDSIFHYTPRAS